MTLGGILGPVTTTFQPGADGMGELDRVAFAANIRAYLGAGLAGVVVCGSTGEAALLDERERAALVEAAREAVPPDRPVVVGTGAESTRACMRLSRQAAERGADAVLVVAPHYYGTVMSAAALHRHYVSVAEASPVPVLLYNIPKYMHFSLAPTLVEELAQHPNIVGIKDSSGNTDLLSTYLNAQSAKFTVLTGHGGSLATALEMGVRGGILAVSLFAPALALAVYEAGRRGDDEGRAAARGAQTRLSPLSNRIVGELGIAGIKAALDLVGLAGGPVRAPLTPLGPQDVEGVAQLLRGADVPRAA